MPIMWLRAHAEAIEGLQAEEAFRIAEIVAVGSGTLQEREQNRVTHSWRIAMRGKNFKPKNAIDVFRSMGIPVTIVGKE
jgi:hypothetical protein